MTVIRVSICLLGGALAPQLSSFPPGSDQIAIALVLLVVLLPVVRRGDAVCVLAGALLYCGHVERVVEARLSPALATDSLLVTVRIADFPRSHRASSTFVAKPQRDERFPSRLRLSWFEPPVELRLGDVWQLQVRLRRPRGTSNPGGLDAESWLTRQRIGATGYVVAGALNELVDSGTAGGIDRLRKRMLARIDRRLGVSETGAAIAAIVVGARHRLSDDQWDRYARTGTSHLMAISGLHVGLAAVGAFVAARGLFGLLPVVRDQRRAALLLSLAVAVLYAAVSGFAVPARRAVIMLMTVGIALLLRRDVVASRVLAAAAIAVFVIDPLATMAPGFWLSFAAVAVLYWFAARMPGRRPALTGRPFLALRDLAVVQLLLFIGLLPFTVLFFDRVSLSAPLVNLVAVPLFSLLTVPFALLSLLLSGPLDSAGGLLLDIAAWGVDQVESLIAVAADEPRSSRLIPAVSGVAVAGLALTATWTVFPIGWPGRFTAWVGVLFILAWRPGDPPRGCTDISVLDVGQGLAVVVRSGTHTLVYDTGPAYRNSGSAARQVVLPYLASIGVSRIDRLVISHGDLDHAGGVGDIAAELDVIDVLSGEPEAVPGSRRCHAGVAWSWESARFRFLHPDEEAHYVGNDASCVLLVETGRRRTLLTGDIEAPVEGRLVRRRLLSRVDVITVPHHGSRTSSIAPFVHAVAPRYAIVAAAAANQWGFPKPDVVARWQARGTRILNTATSGAIRVRQCDDDRLRPPAQHRRDARRIWHDDSRDAEF